MNVQLGQVQPPSPYPPNLNDFDTKAEWESAMKAWQDQRQAYLDSIGKGTARHEVAIATVGESQATRVIRERKMMNTVLIAGAILGSWFLLFPKKRKRK